MFAGVQIHVLALSRTVCLETFVPMITPSVQTTSVHVVLAITQINNNVVRTVYSSLLQSQYSALTSHTLRGLGISWGIKCYFACKRALLSPVYWYQIW